MHEARPSQAPGTTIPRAAAGPERVLTENGTPTKWFGLNTPTRAGAKGRAAARLRCSVGLHQQAGAHEVIVESVVALPTDLLDGAHGIEQRRQLGDELERPRELLRLEHLLEAAEAALALGGLQRAETEGGA